MKLFFKGIFYYLNLAWVKFLLFFITSVRGDRQGEHAQEGPDHHRLQSPEQR